MSLETAITQAWQRKAVWLWLLLPISWLYGLISALRRYAYKTGIKTSYRAPVPVMIIGNITIGGSGKTPLIITLVQYLMRQGISVGVISRGYGGDERMMPALVRKDSLPSVVGDEPCLIVATTRVPMAVCPDRKQAIITLLEAYPSIQIIVADDGLQHYALQRDIEWVVVDSARGFGNQQLLPTGFLREPLSRLQDVDVIYHEAPQTPLSLEPRATNDKSNQHSDTQLVMQLQPDKLVPLWQEFACRSAPSIGTTVHALSGIGYPKRFFTTLEMLGYTLIVHPYPDHYNFSLSELLDYTEYPIIMTTKDAVKIRALVNQALAASTLSEPYQELVSRVWVLPVTAVLSDTCYERLQQQLQRYDIQGCMPNAEDV